MMIPVFKPSMGEDEINAVGEVIKSNWIGQGPKTLEFEKKFTKSAHERNFWLSTQFILGHFYPSSY